MPLIEDRFEDTLLLARRDPPSLLGLPVSGGFVLPTVRTAEHHSADVRPTLRAIRDRLGLEATVLNCRTVSVADGVVRRLLELDARDNARSDIRWVCQADLTQVVFVDAAHASAVDDWFRAAVTPPAPPDGRDWTVSGWWTSATNWIALQVEAAGLRVIGAIEQVRAWEFSCVLQVETERGTLYFKALPDSYATEPQLVRYLAQFDSRVRT
jgi:hypothetical protein